MRIEKVSALAFGPLVDQTLSLAPGMTIISGPNESAKSSWHAATYAALCGRRRGKGRPNREEQRFIDAHHPWDSSAWAVAAVVVLDDGRRIEIRQDLDGKVDCRATDLVIGRDVSNEVMWDGSPDASVWLGLNRRSFLATACISQASLLGVLEEADGLQEHLQRAAATGGTDATAAAALECLTTYRRDHVGLDRANSSRPLRRSSAALDLATQGLETARTTHGQYLRVVDDAQLAGELLSSLAEQLRAATSRQEKVRIAVDRAQAAASTARETKEAAASLHRATAAVETLNRRVCRAEVLTDQVAQAPPGITSEARVAEAATGLADWRSSSHITQPPKGPTAAEIRAELAALPEPREGDTAVDETVRAIATGLERAQAVAQAHEATRVQTEPMADDATQAALRIGPQLVRELAEQLAALPTRAAMSAAEGESLFEAQIGRDVAETRHVAAREAHGTAAQQHSTARIRRDRAVIAADAAVASTASGRRTALMIAGALGFVALLLVFALSVVAGAAAAILALAIAGYALTRSSTAPDSVASTLAKEEVALRAASGLELEAASQVEYATTALSDAERRYAAQLGSHEQIESTRAATEITRTQLLDYARSVSLPAAPQELRDLAARAEEMAVTQVAEQDWKRRSMLVKDSVRDSTDELVAALLARGMMCDMTSVGAGLATYEQACQERAGIGTALARRDGLERELATRLSRDSAAQLSASHAERAGQELLRLAVQLTDADSTTTPDQAGDRIAGWLADVNEDAAIAAAMQEASGELLSILDGETLDQLIAGLNMSRSHETTARTTLQQLNERSDTARTTADVAARDAGCTRDFGLEVLQAAAKVIDQELLTITAQHNEAIAVARRADGVRSERGRNLIPVAEAEEQLGAAIDEHERVLDLDRILTSTSTFLTRAQERVHRDIAPLLAAALAEWLPRITDGRYVDATVDPATLQVRVCGPDRLFRKAELLSHGTAEQIYLLLRTALTKHLTSGHDTCPLLLDDVTVQADSVRTREILDLLHSLSKDRQVILFSQEPLVADWATKNLTSDRDAMHKLASI